MFDPVTVLSISNIIFVNIIWIAKCFRSNFVAFDLINTVCVKACHFKVLLFSNG